MWSTFQRKHEHYRLYFSYATTNYEELEERLIMGNQAFVASVGGYLGLFLGYSALSCLLAMYNDLTSRSRN